MAGPRPRLDVDDFAYDMWWRGGVPRAVQAEFDKFGDVKVRLHEAKHTKRELEAASKAVSRYPSDMFDVVTSTTENKDRPTPEYGIQVEVTKEVDMSDEAIGGDLTEATGLPVSVDPDLAARLLTKGRSARTLAGLGLTGLGASDYL